MRKMDPENFAAIEKFINTYHTENGVSPSIYEIAGGVGLSKSSVGRYMAYMREHGMLEVPCRRGAVTQTMRKSLGDTVAVPVLGAVSCGIPKLAVENIEEYVRLPSSLFGCGSFYILRANGDSMIGAGIDDGDLVLIRVQEYAEPGQIVVALVDDEATLKRFYPESGRIRLQPENSTMEPIYVDSCTVQGVAVKVMKDLV